MNVTATIYLSGLFDAVARTDVTGPTGERISLDDGIARTVETVTAAKRSGAKVMLIGNGGSAAIASHVQNDLCKGVGVRALVMSEPPLMMALANDDGYETIFERQIALWAQPSDLLLAISSGGRSPNVLRGVEAARRRHCDVVTFSGFAGDNPLRRLGGINFHVPASEYGPVELGHSILLHLVTDRASRILA